MTNARPRGLRIWYILQPPRMLMLLSWWCPLGHDKRHLPATQIFIAVRLIPILTHLSSGWTVPLIEIFLQYHTCWIFLLPSGTGSLDRFKIIGQKLTDEGLNKGRRKFLNFPEAPTFNFQKWKTLREIPKVHQNLMFIRLFLQPHLIACGIY